MNMISLKRSDGGDLDIRWDQIAAIIRPAQGSKAGTLSVMLASGTAITLGPEETREGVIRKMGLARGSSISTIGDEALA